MDATMMHFTVAAREIINLAEVYKDVRVDNPMGAYTRKIVWQVQDFPGMTFGEPLCNSSADCPAVTEEDIKHFVVPDRWSDHHDRRRPITQKAQHPSECLGKTRHTFIFQPVISDQDHVFVTGKMQAADTWARLQKSLGPLLNEQSVYATYAHVLDQLWGVCQRGDESKPYRSRNGKQKAKDEIYFCPAVFEKMIVKFMGIKQIEFGDSIQNKSNKDPKQTADMKSMTVADYGKLRAGNHKVRVQIIASASKCNSRPGVRTRDIANCTTPVPQLVNRYGKT